ncbi:MAG: hypothetical protein HY096_02080 [Nitrospinae bacterium]|nr:hypothetical protein [Nitrospinota bacterium]MBI3815172.1 hypothetical protein [Nitrospinota bacterium]
MPTLILPANKHISLKRKVPRSGFIEIYIESDKPVTSYILDEDGNKAFYDAQPEIPSYGGFTNRKLHHQKVYLDFQGDFYFIIMNEKIDPAAIHWEIY